MTSKEPTEANRGGDKHAIFRHLGEPRGKKPSDFHRSKCQDNINAKLKKLSLTDLTNYVKLSVHRFISSENYEEIDTWYLVVVRLVDYVGPQSVKVHHRLIVRNFP